MKICAATSAKQTPKQRIERTMNIDTTCQQLREMRMSRMASQLQQRLANAEQRELAPEEFLALLVEDEYLSRRQKRLDRMVGKAGFKPERPSMEDITYSPARGLDKKDLLVFTSPRWLSDALNVILTGPTGCGKSFIAQAIALQACRMGFAASYIRYPLLFEQVNAARGTGQYLKFLKTMTKTQVIILDDFLMQEVSIQDLSPLMDVIEEKQQTGSIIVTTQYPIAQWHHRMPDPTMADAICDRLTSAAYKFNLKGDQSMRGSRLKSQPK
jgi:DNA replication protein DnaC